MSETPTNSTRMSSRSLDPVNLWINATRTPSPEQERSLTEGRPRSVFWQSFSQLPMSEQSETMRKIIFQWPYPKEYYAAVLPRFAMPVLTFVSASLVAKPIMKSFFLPFTTRTNRAPILIAATTASMAHYALDSLLVQRVLDTDQVVCPHCVTLRRIALTVTVGIFVPAFSFPYLCAYLADRRQLMKFPAVKSSADMLALCVLGSKNVWRMRLLAPLLVAHVVFDTMATYSQLWARDRIIPTLEDDPELFRSLLLKCDESPVSGIEKYVGSLPILRSLIDKK